MKEWKLRADQGVWYGTEESNLFSQQSEKMMDGGWWVVVDMTECHKSPKGI